MKPYIAVLLVGIILQSSCHLTSDRGKPSAPENVDAYVAVYATEELTIKGEAPRPTRSAGKIYTTDRYIFQNELREGIHVIDRSKTPPEKIAFLRIPTATELAVRGNILYTNYYADLLTIDISNLSDPKLLKRINIPVSQDFPPYHGYFVCPDKSQGTIMEWKLQRVEKANCQR